MTCDNHTNTCGNCGRDICDRCGRCYEQYTYYGHAPGEVQRRARCPARRCRWVKRLKGLF